MEPEELITSGLLEMYVVGALPPSETTEVQEAVETFPEVKKEVEDLESSLINLAEAVSPTLSAMVWSYILARIDKVRTLQTGRTNWAAISGWAAAILCILGIFWMLKQNNQLQDDIQTTSTKNAELNSQMDSTRAELADANEVLDVLRSKDYTAYTLPGNEAVAPQAFAKVYYNKKDKIAYIDSKGLPQAPRGKVYQVWSVIMQPLTPRSIGLLGTGAQIETNMYQFVNVPDAEAFGITLEPEGGSQTPTMSQLYILGQVTSKP